MAEGKHAEAHAFSKGIVSEDDKDSYDAVFQHLRNAVAGAIKRSTASDELDDWTCKFGRDGGIQGQRPKDLWASIINRNSESFSKFPQVYVIASERGVEVGFSVTIHEDDYYNTEVKRKNRAVVPLVNAKLPQPDSQVVTQIGNALSSEQGWIFAEKTRQAPASSFTTLSELIGHLKSAASSAKGGGAICRLLSFEEVAAEEKRLEDELVHALILFRPIMQLLQPTASEAQYARNLVELAEYAEAIPPFDPEDEDDGKKQDAQGSRDTSGAGQIQDGIARGIFGEVCAFRLRSGSGTSGSPHCAVERQEIESCLERHFAASGHPHAVRSWTAAD